MKKDEKIEKNDQLGINITYLNYIFFNSLNRKLKLIKKGIFGLSIGVVSITTCFAGMLSVSASKVQEENAIIYEEEIEEYNNEIKEYAKYINSLELTNLEIIIKVMNDMWSNIYGYKTPDNYDVLGYQRLALYNNGYGVCRNMADDFTARMNAINPEYEACNLYVYIENAELNNIKTNILASEEIITEENENDTNNNEQITNIIGNHMVSCIKLKEEDVFLIVDPTNPSIGVLKNGKITMLSNQVSDGIEIKPIGNIVMGIDEAKDYLGKTKESFFMNGDIDTLKEKYGIKSQNETLSQIIENYDTDNYGIKY